MKLLWSKNKCRCKSSNFDCRWAQWRIRSLKWLKKNWMKARFHTRVEIRLWKKVSKVKTKKSFSIKVATCLLMCLKSRMNRYSTIVLCKRERTSRSRESTRLRLKTSSRVSLFVINRRPRKEMETDALITLSSSPRDRTTNRVAESGKTCKRNKVRKWSRRNPRRS